MSLLQSIVTQVVQNAVQGDQRSQQQGGLGGLLGGLADSQNSNAGLGGVLGQVLGSQGSSQAGLGGLLRDVLGGGAQSRQASPTDLGDILGGVLGSQSQAQSRQGGFNKSTLLLALLPVVLAYIQKNGGLSGVLAKLQGNGLGNKAQSWTSIDVDNDGIDADDVARLFGSQEINEVAQKTGASELEVRQGIAGLLPQIMNDLTPHGSVEADESEANAEIDQILSQLRGKF
ncbi:YidB family protein [Moraxella bovoculi]|uniref:YidB family protein n=1 Tax=Moraxella bovoculi TaxID=386891 RepID=UPI003F4F609B